MLDSKIIEQLPGKIILIVLILLEIAVIAFSYSIQFDDYISVVIIVLSVLIAYFAYHYLAGHFREIKTYEAITFSTKPNEVDDETRKAVDNLM